MVQRCSTISEFVRYLTDNLGGIGHIQFILKLLIFEKNSSMKKVFLVLLCMLSVSFCFSQWTVTNFNTATDVISIKFYGATDVWLACDTGIFRSVNNGASFSQNGLYYPAGNIFIGSYLNDVAIINTTTAIGAGLFYLGNDEMIIRTTNSAVNWDTVQHTGSTLLAQFHATDFPTATTGYVVGWQGRIFRSVNGGLTWTGVYSNSTITLYDVAMVSANEGAAVGDKGIYYTSNGTAWSQVLNISGSLFNSVSFKGAVGYAGGSSSSGSLYKSTNNGASWSVANFPYGEIKGLQTISADTVVAVTQNAAYETCNGGLYWEEFVLPALPAGTHNFKDIAFRGNEGYIACTDGVLLKTSNGGGVTKPIASFSLPASPFCQNMSYSFTNTSPVGYSYQWQIDGNAASTSYNFTTTLTDSGSHIISLIAFNGSLYDTLSQNVYVNALDFIQPVSFNADTICPGTTATISVFNTSNQFQYQLRNGFTNIGAAVFGNNGTLNFNVPSLQSSVTYNIKVWGSNSCYTDSSVTSILQTVFPDKTIPVIVGDTNICSGKENYHVDIQNTQPGVLYKLIYINTVDSAYGNGGTITLQTPILYGQSNFNYLLSAYANASCYAIMRNITLDIDTNYVRFSVLNPNVNPGETVSFINFSVGDAYLWTFPPQASIQSSMLQYPTVSFSTPGVYDVKLKVTNIAGCADSSTAKVYVLSPAPTGITNFCGNTSVAPNSFTPYDSYIDKDKNVYMTGAHRAVTVGDDLRFAVLKMDSLGNLLWYKQAFDSYNVNSVGQGIAVDANGNVYAAGFFKGTKIYLGSLELDAGIASNNKGFLVKYDANGNELWAITAGKTNFSGIGAWFSDVVVDSSGRIFFGGVHENSVFRFPDGSTFTATGDSTSSFLMSVDSMGLNHTYTTFGATAGGRTTWGDLFINTTPRLSLMANNDLMITSCFSDSSNNMQTQFGSFNFTDTCNVVYAVVYNKVTGFKKVMRGPSGGIISLQEAIVDDDNNVYMTGRVRRNLEYKNNFYTLDVNLLNSSFPYPIQSYIAKLDSSGNTGWINYARFNSITDITVNSNKELMFSATVDSNGFFRDQSLLAHGITTIGKSDAVIGKYNSTGNLVFANKLGTAGHDAAYSINLDNCDNMIVSMSTNLTNASVWPEVTYFPGSSIFGVHYFSKDNFCTHDATCSGITNTLADDAELRGVFLSKPLTAYANIPVSVKLKSLGINPLLSAQIIVEVNGVQQLSFPWSGSITQYNSIDTVALGQITFSTAGLQIIKAYVKLPNGNTDLNNSNDTVYSTIDVCAPLAGTYTIGNGGNFSSFSDAVNHLNECGLGGHVYFDVMPGTYSDVINLKNIPSSVNDSIVFRSLNHDSSGVVLQAIAGYPFGDALVMLDNTNYITLYQMTIRYALSNSFMNRNIRTFNGCEHLNLWNCVIERANPDTIAGSYLFAQSFSGDEYLSIKHNLFFQGGYGVDLTGSNQSNTVIQNNRFINQTFGSIKTNSCFSTLISDNYIETDFHATSYFGISSSSASGALTIARNKLVIKNGDAAGIGIGGNHTLAAPVTVANNMISILQTKEYARALTTSGNSSYINYYNNSVYLDGQSTRSMGFYHSGTGTANLELKNNVIVMADSGTALRFEKFKNQGINLDYNCYYTQNPVIVINDTTSNASGKYASLAQWQAYSLTDANSKIHEAAYTSSTDLHIINDSIIDNAGVAIAGITDDFVLDVRDPVTPDMGCDEFVGNPNLVNVWPGDANNNKVVDNYDIVPLGFYFNQTGNARSAASNLFAPQQALKWGATQFNGSDKVFADCNGNGTINYDDTTAVRLNYNQAHLFTGNGQNKKPVYDLFTSLTGPDLYFISNDSVYLPGENVNIEVWSGTIANPVLNLMALGFQMAIDPQIIEPGTYNCTVSGNWISSSGNCITFTNADEATGRSDATIVKNDGISESGYGKIATITFTVNTSISAVINQPLDLLNYFAVDPLADSILFNVIPDSILAGTTGVHEIVDNRLFIYPNPVTDQLNIIIPQSAKGEMLEVRIVDMTGRILLRSNKKSNKSPLKLNTSSLSVGNYVVEVMSDKTVLRKKLIKH